MILALVGCGSDDAGEGDGGADTTVESSTDGGQSGGTGGSAGAEPSISLDAPPSDGKAEITIDGQKLEGDLMVMCSSTSQLGAPNSVFITGNQGQPTVGGTKIDGLITISIGYGPESGGKMPIADGSANIRALSKSSRPPKALRSLRGSSFPASPTARPGRSR